MLSTSFRRADLAFQPRSGKQQVRLRSRQPSHHSDKIQALQRSQPGLSLKKGRAQSLTHDCKRQGTTTLFDCSRTTSVGVFFFHVFRPPLPVERVAGFGAWGPVAFVSSWLSPFESCSWLKT
jgi:hypothetical protein